MISKLDILKLQDLPIEQVAEALQIGVHRHKAVCPFHDDTRPSLTFNVHKNRYRCYVCDAKGGVIDLVMHSQGWNFYESCQWLAHQFGIILSDDRDFKPQQVKLQPIRPIREIRVQEEKPDIAYLSRLMAQPILNPEAERFLFDERKLNREVIRKIGISSISYNCPMSSSPKPTYFDGPALLIPYRDIDGNLISVQSRYLGIEDKPRFRFPKGSTCHVFNLNVLKNLSPEEPVFITEGVSDCLAMLSAGFASIAIPSATLLKKEDLEHLKGRKLHMYPDADEPGMRLFSELNNLLSPSTRGEQGTGRMLITSGRSEGSQNSSGNGGSKTRGGLIYHKLPSGFKDVGQYYAFIHKSDH